MNPELVGASLILVAGLSLNEKIARRFSLQFSSKPPTDLYDFPELDQIILEKGIGNVYHTVQQQYQYESVKHFYRPLMQRVMQIRAQEPLDPDLVIDPHQRELHLQRVIFAARQQIIISYVDDPRTVMASFIQKFPMGPEPDVQTKIDTWEALAGVLEYSLGDALELFGIDSGDKVLTMLRTLRDNNLLEFLKLGLGGTLTFLPLLYFEWLSSEARISSGDIWGFAYSYMRFVWGIVAGEVLKSRLNRPEMQELLHFFIYLFISIMFVYFFPEPQNNNPTRFAAPYLEWGSYAPLMGYVAGEIMRRIPPSPEAIFYVWIFSSYVTFSQTTQQWLIGQLAGYGIGSMGLVAAAVASGFVGGTGVTIALQGFVQLLNILQYMIFAPPNLRKFNEGMVVEWRRGVFNSFILVACLAVFYNLSKYRNEPTPQMVYICNEELGFSDVGRPVDQFIDNVFAGARNDLQKDNAFIYLQNDARAVLKVHQSIQEQYGISPITKFGPGELKEKLKLYCPWILRKIIKDPLGPLVLSVLGPGEKPILNILFMYTAINTSQLDVEDAEKNLKELVNNASGILKDSLDQKETPSHAGLQTGNLINLGRFPSLVVAIAIARVAAIIVSVVEYGQGAPVMQQVLTMGAGNDARFVLESIERYNATECSGAPMEYDEFIKRLVLPLDGGLLRGTNKGDFKYSTRWMSDLSVSNVTLLSNYKLDCSPGEVKLDAIGQQRLLKFSQYMKSNLREYSPVRKVSFVRDLFERMRPQIVYGPDSRIIQNPQFRNKGGGESRSEPQPVRGFYNSFNSALDQVWGAIFASISLKGGVSIATGFTLWYYNLVGKETLMGLTTPAQIDFCLRLSPTIINYMLKRDIGYVPREMLRMFGMVFRRMQRAVPWIGSKPGPPGNDRAFSTTEAGDQFDAQRVIGQNRMMSAYLTLEAAANIWGFWDLVDSDAGLLCLFNYFGVYPAVAFVCLNFASTIRDHFQHENSFKLYIPSNIPARVQKPSTAGDDEDIEIKADMIVKQRREEIMKNSQNKTT